MSNVIGVLITLAAALLHNHFTAADQHMERRTNVRAALANKLDPNFWPSRGRRSEINMLKQPTKPFTDVANNGNQRRQNSDEEGPFWANRGRSLSEIDHFFSVLGHDKGDSSWMNMGRSSDDEGPFWANRGRSMEESGPFWANRGRALEDGPFWANRGRSLDTEGPFWANRGHYASSNSGEEGPFWANRGRREGDDEERLRRDTLYVDEPGWITKLPNTDRRFETSRRAIFPDVSNKDVDMFWVARGKKFSPKKRELGVFLPNRFNLSSAFRNRRANKLNRALEQLKDAQFWPSRGKKHFQSEIPTKFINYELKQGKDNVTHHIQEQSLP